MAHRHIFKAVDRTLRDIMSQIDLKNKEKYFGNKVMLFGGDFRQILPVTKNGNRSAIVKSSLKNTDFWNDVKQFKLTENMRIKSAAINQNRNSTDLMEFATFLLNIGEGLIKYIQNSKYNDEIALPNQISKNMDASELIQKVYPNLDQNYLDVEFMTSRAILAPTNEEVDRINDLTSTFFPGTSKTYLSTDYVTCEKQKSIKINKIFILYYPINNFTYRFISHGIFKSNTFIQSTASLFKAKIESANNSA